MAPLRRPGEMPEPLGSLTKVRFPELLASLFQRSASGALLLHRGKVKKIAWLKDGHITSVKSNLPEERLGRVMVKEGLVSEAKFERGLEKAQDQGLQIGQGLVQLGYISPQNLEHALKVQARTKLLEVFSWTEGDYQFADVSPPSEDDLTSIDLSVAAVVWDGVHTLRDLSQLRAFNSGLDRLYIHPGTYPLATPDQLSLSHEERQLLSSTHRPLTVAELREQSPFTELETEQLLYGFCCLHLVEFSAERLLHPGAVPPPLPASGFRPRDPMLPELSASHPSSRRNDAELKQRLLAKIAELSSLDWFTVLGVSRTATPEAIRGAYYALARRYHPDKTASTSEQTKKLAQRIYDLISLAYETLSHPEERSKYLASLESQEEACGTDPEHNLMAEGHFQRGEALARAGKFAQALEALQEAVRLSPKEALYHAWLGYCRFRQQPNDAYAREAALASLEEAISRNPRSEWGHLFTGLLQRALGRPDKALKSLETAQKCNPDNPEVRRALKSLQQAFR